MKPLDLASRRTRLAATLSVPSGTFSAGGPLALVVWRSHPDPEIEADMTRCR